MPHVMSEFISYTCEQVLSAINTTYQLSKGVYLSL